MSRVLIVGGGGREHAIAWRWHQDAPGDDILVAPGNAGTVDIAENVRLDVTDATALARLASERSVDLVVIGPDAALAAGVTDACHAAGIAVFGPTAAAARIESSKSYAKQVMERAGIPTARWAAGDVTRRHELLQFVSATRGRCVVKADGLALGKGVTVCESEMDASAAVTACFDDHRFGDAGAVVVVEELLEGVELSVFGITDGRALRVLPSSRDHKRAEDGDRGPNTGGMGAVAPAPGVSKDLVDHVARTVLQPCVDALRDTGSPFVGCLYAGLMLTPDGIRVLEFNARFGDPEAQSVLPLLGEALPSMLSSAAHGELSPGMAAMRDCSCVTVVAVADGYPESPRTGNVITGLDALEDDVLCFHAGTRIDDQGVLRTSGGRVLGVTACGPGVESARQIAYANLNRVHFDGMRYRTDIGAQPVALEVTG